MNTEIIKKQDDLKGGVNMTIKPPLVSIIGYIVAVLLIFFLVLIVFIARNSDSYSGYYKDVGKIFIPFLFLSVSLLFGIIFSNMVKRTNIALIFYILSSFFVIYAIGISSKEYYHFFDNSSVIGAFCVNIVLLVVFLFLAKKIMQIPLFQHKKLKKQIRPLLDSLNEYCYDGKGTITAYNENVIQLYKKDSRQILSFEYEEKKQKSLKITWKYQSLEKGRITYEKTTPYIFDLKASDQKELARNIIREFEFQNDEVHSKTSFESNLSEKSEKVIEVPTYFSSNNHKRYESGIWTGNDNLGAMRGFQFKNTGNQTYEVSIHILDDSLSNWGDKIQMTPKPMEIISKTTNRIILRGFGKDDFGEKFSDYGVELFFENGAIASVALKLHDRNVDIVYFNQ